MRAEKSNQSWFVYIVACRDGTLYTGITTDLTRRLAEHNGTGKPGVGAKYTSTRRPVTLVYSESKTTRSEAQQREWQLKRLTKQEKRELILLAEAAH